MSRHDTEGGEGEGNWAAALTTTTPSLRSVSSNLVVALAVSPDGYVADDSAVEKPAAVAFSIAKGKGKEREKEKKKKLHPFSEPLGFASLRCARPGRRWGLIDQLPCPSYVAGANDDVSILLCLLSTRAGSSFLRKPAIHVN
jgi:hypothetical protein